MNNERQLRKIKVELAGLEANNFLVPRNATDEDIARTIKGYLLSLGVKWRYTDECLNGGEPIWKYEMQIGNVEVVDVKVVDDY